MKLTIIAIVVSIFLILGAVFVSQRNDVTPQTVEKANVIIENGKQIVTIDAKGGYSPSLSKVRADMPTVLRIQTKGTFDCSSAVVIPSIDYHKNLPQSGVTEIELPPQKAGSTLEGMCAMGMYTFDIAFE